MKLESLNQTEAKEHLKRWKVGALFMEAGTGKTRVALDLVNSSPCDFCLWVGPLRTIRTERGVASVMDELQKWGGLKMPAAFYGIESLQGSDRIYLEVEERVKAASNPFIVVDESLKIKNYDAKRTKKLLHLAKMAEYKLILNGTPISRNLLDIWAQMEFLSPRILNMSLAQFKGTFCKIKVIEKRGGFRTYTKEFIVGYANIDYLHSLIRHYVYECSLSLDIDRQHRNVYYEVDDDSKEQYYEIKDEFLSLEELDWRNNNIFLAMTTKMQLCYNTCTDKIERLQDLIDEIGEERTIIFCRFISSQEACREAFPKAMVLSYQKEAFGLNLQEYSNIVFFDKIWDYAAREQAEHRIYRTGQEADCTYYDMTCDFGLDNMIDRNIAKKISMSDYLKFLTKKQLEKEL